MPPFISQSCRHLLSRLILPVPLCWTPTATFKTCTRTYFSHINKLSCTTSCAVMPNRYQNLHKFGCTGSHKRRYASESRRNPRDETYMNMFRMVLPGHCNPYNIIHGGNLLTMIEESNHVLCTQYCSRTTTEDWPSHAAVVRVDSVDFIDAVRMGEVADIHSNIVYTSEHTLQVLTDVYATSVFKGKERSRLVNQSSMWYVPFCENNSSRLQRVTPLDDTSTDAYKQGLLQYQENRTNRKCAVFSEETGGIRDGRHHEPFSVPYSSCSNCYTVMPGNAFHGICTGGAIMFWMDEMAGVTVARHVQGGCVTVGVEDVNFHSHAFIGHVLKMTSLCTYTSRKSIEVQVIVDVYDPSSREPPQRAAEAYFQFVAFSPDCKTRDVPPLLVQTPAETVRYESGRARYEQRKASSTNAS